MTGKDSNGREGGPWKERRAFLREAGTVIGAAGLSAALGPGWAWAQWTGEKTPRPPDNLRVGDAAGAGIDSLKGKAAQKGLIYGAACGNRQIANPLFVGPFTKECGMLVPESELKWAALRPASSRFDFGPADSLAAFARSNGMLLRGHTLVWHEALPTWFAAEVTSQNAEQVLRTHIATVMGHYAGRMHSWDVVNEAIYPEHGLPNAMRDTPWLRLLGERYIEIAFRAAAAADPRALLVYNQNHLEYENTAVAGMRGGTLRLLERLKASGTPVHALGIQAHLGLDNGVFNATAFRSFLRSVSGLGLKILITELDVADYNLPYDIAERDRIVAGTYESFLSAVLDEPAVIAVITWGLCDSSSWLADYRTRPDRAAVRPLPLDAECRRKPAWYAMARAFERAPYVPRS